MDQAVQIGFGHLVGVLCDGPIPDNVINNVWKGKGALGQWVRESDVGVMGLHGWVTEPRFWSEHLVRRMAELFCAGDGRFLGLHVDLQVRRATRVELLGIQLLGSLHAPAK